MKPEPRTMCEAFQRTAARYPTEIALRTVGDATTVSWTDYAQRVRSLAEGLAALGVGHRDTVAIMLRNRPEFHIVDAAAMHLGAVPFSVFNTSSPEQVAWLVSESGTRVVVTEQLFLPVVTPPAAASGATVITVDGSADGTLDLADVASRTADGFDFEATWRSVRPDDILTLIYTSGTTGRPKGVEITHRAELAECAATNKLFGVRPGDRFVSFLPSAHIADRWSAHYTQMTAGTQVTTVGNPRDIAAALVDARPHVFGAVPQVWQRLYNAVRAVLNEAAATEGNEARRAALTGVLDIGLRYATGLDQGSLTPELKAMWQQLDAGILTGLRTRMGLDQVRVAISGAAPIAPALLLGLRGLGIPVSNVLGMSELSGTTTYSPPGEASAASVGRPIPGVEVSLGKDGELLVRGEVVMRGYRDAPEATAAAVDNDGWLHTGDIATLSPDGAVTIVDRKKDLMISSGGKNLSPSAIEGTLLSHCPLLAHAALIGDARPFVTALLVPDPEALTVFATEHALDADPADLPAHPTVLAAVTAGVQRANAALSGPEQVRDHTVLAEVWEPGSEVLTHTRKLRRGPINERYAPHIEAMYAAYAAKASAAPTVR
ncbi:AMP-dependent synthetase/ligase [Streptomyces fulvoviolaceus]|uniref:AMP-dependent synthetase/ligase n=1 Tax=Streptomyces fulvoviolaceus TaxID=285535 RepID=UPI0005B83305|nr:AMP-dependent synthetase/ligase [Streptomyces fulvoviolaceus]